MKYDFISIPGLVSGGNLFMRLLRMFPEFNKFFNYKNIVKNYDP